MALTRIFGPGTTGGGDYSDPQPVNAVQNTAIYYIYSSTLSGQPNFKYIYDLKIKGSTYTYKVPPAPVNGYGQIAFSDILKTYVSYDLLPTVGSLYVRATQSYATYSYCVTEEYDPGKTFSDTQYVGTGSLGLTFSTPHGFSTGDVVTVKMNNPFLNPQYNGTASVVSVPNAYLIELNKTFDAVTYQEGGSITNVVKYSTQLCFPDTDLGLIWNGNRQYTNGNENYDYFRPFWAEPYSNPSPAYRKFLSYYSNYLNVNTSNPELYNFPSLKPVFCRSDYTSPSLYGPDQYESLTWLDRDAYGPTNYAQIEIRVVNNDNSTSSYSISVGSTASTYGGNMFVVGVGPQQLNNQFIFDPITTNTKNYYIRLLNRIGGAWSEWRGYTIYCNCSPWNNYRIYFQNALGAMDYWNFNWLSRRTYNTDRTTYNKTLSYNWKGGDRGETTLSQKVDESLYLSSDWLDEYQAEYLKELIYSPEVYWFKEITNDERYFSDITDRLTLVPITINTNSYEIKTNLKDRLYCISFEANMAFGVSTQNN